MVSPSHFVFSPCQLSPARKIFAFIKIFTFTFPLGSFLSECAGDSGDLLPGRRPLAGTRDFLFSVFGCGLFSECLPGIFRSIFF